MARTLEEIDPALERWIGRQQLFFVGTAPLSGVGHVNVSPKGGRGLFRVTGPLGFAYVDLMGSGIETVAHLRENGRITVMFAAFEGPPKIVRLHGKGRVVQQEDDGFGDLLATFDAGEEQLPAVRSVIVVEVTRVSDSCGFVVPLMAYEGEREHHAKSSAKRVRTMGADGYQAFARERNAESIDGLPAVTLREPTQP